MIKRPNSELDNDDDGLEEESSKKVRFESSLVEKKSEELIEIKKNTHAGDRFSNLQAPTMQLSGHEGAVYSLAFDPTGKHLASSSLDRQIFLWDVYGDCKNYNVLSGHKNAVLEVKWGSDGLNIVSCSADKTVGVWDANKGKRIRKFTEHTGIVNSCSIAERNPSLLVSGSDDCSVILWDCRSRRSVTSLYHDYQVTSVSLSADGYSAYSGGIDNIIRRWDMRKLEAEGVVELSLAGHDDTVTGLAISPSGNFLLSNSMDSSLRCWDVRPFVSDENSRCEKLYDGVHHGAEKLLLRCAWSADEQRVSCGSADRIVRIWDANTSALIYYLPGHKGSVNEVLFHPSEPIIASCGSDKQIFLGELAS